MPLLNVSFGIFAFMPLGWLFMAFVILLEGVIMTRLLLPKWFNAEIYRITAWTNIISGIIGIAISMFLNGGWYLVVWFPWISEHEIDLTHKGSLQFLLIYYAAAFVLTLVIETFTNVFLLHKEYLTRRIITTTIIANVISYAIGTLVLYSYSFN